MLKPNSQCVVLGDGTFRSELGLFKLIRVGLL